jgi:hypothetical protein
MRRRPVVMMARWRQLPAATHRMAAIPDAFARHTGMRLGTDGRECCGECRKQDEQYEFAHGSILQWLRTDCGERKAEQQKKKDYTPRRVTL